MRAQHRLPTVGTRLGATTASRTLAAVPYRRCPALLCPALQVFASEDRAVKRSRKLLKLSLVLGAILVGGRAPVGLGWVGLGWVGLGWVIELLQVTAYDALVAATGVSSLQRASGGLLARGRHSRLLPLLHCSTQRWLPPLPHPCMCAAGCPAGCQCGAHLCGCAADAPALATVANSSGPGLLGRPQRLAKPHEPHHTWQWPPHRCLLLFHISLNARLVGPRSRRHLCAAAPTRTHVCTSSLACMQLWP